MFTFDDDAVYVLEDRQGVAGRQVGHVVKGRGGYFIAYAASSPRVYPPDQQSLALQTWEEGIYMIFGAHASGW